MKFHRTFFAIFIFSLAMASEISALGKKDKAESGESSENQKEYIKIDLLLDTKNSGAKNHFKWQTSKNSYSDTFDAVSGASKVHSTKLFREASLDTASKSLKTPKGLRNLCLFAVANPELLKADNFSASQEGSKITVTFTHRGNSYIIESDEKGIIRVPEGFFIKLKEVKKETTEETTADAESKQENSKESAEEITEKTENDQNPQEKELKTEEESAEKIPEGFQKDEPAESISMIFTGILKASLSKEGTLSLKGKIKLAKRPEEQKKTEEPQKESSAENESESAEP